MKKNLFFILVAMLVSTGIAIGQYVPGTLPVPGGQPTRGVMANGLSELFSISGNYTLSADGAGNRSSAYSVDVNKPNVGATVHIAYLLDAPVWGNPLPAGFMTLAGTTIVWDGSVINSAGGPNYYKDVTSIVAPIIDAAPAGITSIPIIESSYGLNDGIALLVVFSDPSTFTKTIVIMFGGLSTTGDNFSLTLGTPIDPLDPGAFLDMGLGISFSFQTGSFQNSNIDINGTRLTSSAGGQDDAPGSTGGNGQLITVGGIGDLNTNPPDPNHAEGYNPRYDDELYSLLPLITNTTTNILVNTSNPSNDDNIFLAYFEISGVAIIGEGILLTQTQNFENTGTPHTVKALVQDNNGAPVVGKRVDFTVLSGPNVGNTFWGNTDANGEVTYTYVGMTAGFDDIQACFFDSQSNLKCSNTLTVEWIGSGPPPNVPLSDWAIYFAVLLIGIAIWFRFKTRIA